MPEGSDLRVRHAGEEGQQGGEKVFVVNEAISTGAHQKPSKFTKAGFEAFELGSWGAEGVVHRILENRTKTKWSKHLSTA